MRNVKRGTFVWGGSKNKSFTTMGSMKRLEGMEAYEYAKARGLTLSAYGYSAPTVRQSLFDDGAVVMHSEWEEPCDSLTLADAEEYVVEDAAHLLWIDVHAGDMCYN